MISRDAALIVQTQPPRAYYRGVRPAGIDLARQVLVRWGAIRSELRTKGGANGNATIDLDNGSGSLTTEAAQIPLRAPCSLIEDGVTLLSGQVTRKRIGGTVQLDIEAGSPLRFTDDAPLRTTAAWGAYLRIAALPQVYGMVTLSPLAYDDSGTRWLLADHPITGVDAVVVEGAQYNAWALEHTTDPAGKPVALLVTQDQIESADSIAATLRGKLHPITGESMDLPHLVLWDFLANVCGMPFEESDFDDLRSAATAAGLRIGGVIDDHEISIQGWVDRICQGSGLAWSPQAIDFARVWPVEPGPVVRPGRVLDLAKVTGLTAESDQKELATVVHLAYAHDYAAGSMRRTLRMRAPAAVERYGEIEARIEAGWIHSPSAALAYTTRWLQYNARPVWRVTAARSALDLAPGDSMSADHPYCPLSIVTVMRMNRTGLVVRIDAQAPEGVAPAVEIVSTGAAVAQGVFVGPAYDYLAGILTLLIKDSADNILPGVRCTLDGSGARYTDARGYVRFDAVAEGSHTLRVDPSGEPTITYELTL